MDLIFLGTGTSSGIPVIGCHCEVCRSKNEKDKRMRSSIYVKSEETALVIDTGPDFRMQILHNEIEHLDAALITHTHKDHIAGLDDAKSFADINKRPFPIFANGDSAQIIENEFAYAFQSLRYPGIPNFELRKIDDQPFFIHNLKITPIPVMHYRLPILGYRIGSFAYITDASEIPSDSLKKLQDLDILVINALRITKHIAHFTLEEAIDMIRTIKPKKAYLTHMSHHLGLHDVVFGRLPKNIFLAYDGLKISC